MNTKIKMVTPLVEIDGDEMTRVIWKMIKNILLIPYIDLNTEYYDLGLKNREKTLDKVTIESAYAIKKYGVAVKCATITANHERVSEYNLSRIWPSPNATIRSIIGGTIFRAPIVINVIENYIPSWQQPITIARHAYGDVYSAVELKVNKNSNCELVSTDSNEEKTSSSIHYFESDGIVMGMHNTDDSIREFAKTCFDFALVSNQNLWFATKDTVSRIYDRRFKDIFQEIYEKEYKDKFKIKNIKYFYTLIDDAIARAIRSKGGFIWACKNYDGDVISDLIASAFGSLAMMTSVLVTSNGLYEYEAAHGTVQKHYYRYLNGEQTSTNPIATIFAWSGALRKRGEMDDNIELIEFSTAIEDASIKTIENGVMTKDLISISTIKNKKEVNTKVFLESINKELYNILKS